MRNFYLKFSVIVWAVFSFQTALAQERALSENAVLSVLTCDTGNELYSLFGHTAIRVSDPINGIDIVYNYGAFDFRTPNFYLKFIKGDMKYFVTTDTYEDFIAEYLYENRGVYEQKLNLTAAQKQQLFDRLEAVLHSQGRFYTYKFVDRNCTTMVVDQVERTIRHPLSLKVDGYGIANRKILYDYQHDHFYENLGINIMFGAKTDREFYKIYLPLQFLESLEKSTNNGHPLAEKAQIVNPKRNGSTPFSWWNNYFTYVIFVAFFALVNKPSFYLSWLIFSGLLGIFLIWAGFYSLHEELALNYNVLLFNPVFLLLALFCLKGNNRNLIRNTAYCCGILLFFYTAWMLNKAHFLMFLPMILANAAILWRIARKAKS